MKYFKTGLFVICAALVLGACSKNEYIPNTEIPSAAAMLSKAGLVSINPEDIQDFQQIPLAVTVSSAKDLKKDLVITLELDQAALTEYNTRYLTDYQMIPAEALQMPTSVTIPGGASTISIPVAFNLYKITGDPGDFVIPVTIKDARSVPIDDKHKTVLFKLNRPSYAGDYAASGSRKAVRADGTVFLDQPYTPPAHDKTLTQIAPNLYSISKVSNLAITGSQVFQILINEDNSVTVSGTYGGWVFRQLANERSYYDPLTKTFYLNYDYLVTTDNSTRQMREVLVRK